MNVPPGVLSALALLPFSFAQVALAAAPSQQCEAAISAATATDALPQGLLHAIAVVESGRPEAPTGTAAPWPWTVDVDGEGSFYDTKAAAIEAVRTAQREGHLSIDTGCLQINLRQHPEAFASLEAAFDPMANAKWAADFLTTLRARSASWLEAAGLYHSASPAVAAPYRQRVEAAWTGSPGGSDRQAPTMLAGNNDAPFAPIAPFGAQMPGFTRVISRGGFRAPMMLASGPGHGLAYYRATALARRG